MSIVAGKEAAVEIQAQSVEWVDAESHFAFDWNGWGFGVEPEGEQVRTVAAWQSEIRAIIDDAERR